MINQKTFIEQKDNGFVIFSHIIDPDTDFKFDSIYCDNYFSSKESAEAYAQTYWNEVAANIDNFDVLYNLMSKYNFKYLSKESIH